MIYQFLRVALCAAFLVGNSAHAVGKRALWNFVEAKKELQKKLIELRKMDSTSDVDKSEALIVDIQKSIDEVKKLDPTKAAEFQEVLDASFEQEVAGLAFEAGKTKQAAKEEIEKQATTIAAKAGKIVESVKNLPNEAVKAAARNGYLDYLSYVTVPVSWVTYPFTALITKSYKISVRLLDFMTRGKVEAIHNTYLGILTQEQDALVASIVNTSLIAALKINSFLHRLLKSSSEDVTAELLPQEKRWYLGKIYDKVKGTLLSSRTNETFSGSQLHRIVMGELLEYGALLTPVIDLSKHEGLNKQISNINEYLNTILQHSLAKKSISDDEKNLIAALYEMHETLFSANEESKKILDPETKKAVYPEGKFSEFFHFQANRDDFEKILAKAGIDKAKMLDTRSYAAQLKDMIGKQGSKVRAYQDSFAAVAGLALTIAGGSYLVENYFPERFKNKYTKYVVASMGTLIAKVGEYVTSGSDKTRAAVTAIWSKIPQLPCSDKIKSAVSNTYVKATSWMVSGATLMNKLYSKVRGSQEIALAQQQEEERREAEDDAVFFRTDPVAQNSAMEANQENFDLQEIFRNLNVIIEKTNDINVAKDVQNNVQNNIQIFSDSLSEAEKETLLDELNI